MERPILFSGPMVRAILEGRKTQTRRVIKPQPVSQGMLSFGEAWKWNEGGEHWFSGVTAEQIKNPHYGLIKSLPCPCGSPGDRLWVRETCDYYGGDESEPPVKRRIIYRADEGSTPRANGRWCSPLLMPRWASRITLEIVKVRVERVQDIGLRNVQCEGLTFDPRSSLKQMRMAFAHLWNSINEKRGFGWDKNPWVWVVEFKRVQP